MAFPLTITRLHDILMSIKNTSSVRKPIMRLLYRCLMLSWMKFNKKKTAVGNKGDYVII